MKLEVVSTIGLIGFSVISGVAGQTVIKLGVNHPNAAGFIESGPLGVLSMVFRSPLVMLGLMIYGVSAFAWIIVLSRVDLSYAYPFLALNFVLITVISRLVLSETVPTLRWIGIGIICIGLLLVARSTANA